MTEVGRRIGDRIDELLESLWDAGGTDLLLTVGTPPLLRVHGDLRPVADHPPLSAADTDALLAELLNEDQHKSWQVSNEYDFSFSWGEEARIRGNAFTQRGVTAIALRMIPKEIPSLAALGVPPVLAHYARQHQGLVLMTGPTGSGKSTTLASMIDLVNTE